MSVYVAKKYRLVRKIGSGSFGQIYRGVDIENREDVAIKLEELNITHPQLALENRIYKAASNFPGIPKVKWFGQEGDYTILVLELLGDNLETLLNKCGRQFSLKTVLLLAEKMITRLENLHQCHYIHRDLKPENFVMGRGINKNQLYLIDFGLSKKYLETINGIRRHIPDRGGRSMTGTARYASINAHNGKEQSRRDDMEALGYLLIYFLNGTLPWQNLKGRSKPAKYARIAEKKLSTGISQLCAGLPEQFCSYMHYVKSLSFEQQPDYRYLRSLLRSLFFHEFEGYDNLYDWVPLNPENGSDEEDVQPQLLALQPPKVAVVENTPPWSNKQMILYNAGMAPGAVAAVAQIQNRGGNLSSYVTPVRHSKTFLSRFIPRGGGVAGLSNIPSAAASAYPYSLRRRAGSTADLILGPTRAAIEGINAASQLLNNASPAGGGGGYHHRNLMNVYEL